MEGRPARAWWLAGLGAALALGLIVLVVVAGPEPAPRSGSPVTRPETTSTAPGSTGTSTPPPSTTGEPGTTATVPSSAPAAVVRRGPPTQTVALTFDAGSDTGAAAAILDTLAANDVPATFGITGAWADANPALVRRIAEDGHQIVNHTDDHRSFTGRSTGEAALTRSERLAELRGAEASIEAAAGVSPVPWFRPPYGDVDESVTVDVAAAGYRYVLLWTVDSLGWQGAAPADVVSRCLDQAVPGAIYLLHVGAASTDRAALQPIIDGLAARGYTFATVADLVGP